MNYATIGKREIKVDALAKVTGEAHYVDDFFVRGMLIGKVLRSPYAHARIQKIDTSKAAALPGVKAVITYKDTPQVLFNAAGFPPSEGAILLEDQYILSDKARFVGDPIAAVAAIDAETAHEALSLIEVEYEELPVILHGVDAYNRRDVLIHDELAQDNICGRIPVLSGDMEKGFAAADYIFENTYSTQKVFQCSLEPCGASLVEIDANSRLRIHTSTQMPHLVQRIVAQAVNIPLKDVQIIKPYVGGAFGSRLGTVNEPIAALLAKKTGRPVKMIYDRTESFFTESRHPAVMTVKTGLKKDGTFTARYMHAVVDTGAYASHGPSLTAVLGGWFLAMYKSPATQFEGYTVYTNTPPAGAFRGYGNPQVTFAVESQVDEIAHQLGLDPIEMRLKNHPCKGDIWAWSGYPIENCGLEEAMERAAKSIGWKGYNSATIRESNCPIGIEIPSSKSNKRRGMGFAYMMHVSGARPMLHEVSSTVIKVNEDGSVNLTYPSSDLGTGSATALSQIAAETLGIPFEQVIITQFADTDTAPFDIGSHASRQIYSGGYAVQQAALQAKRELLQMAAQLLTRSLAESPVEAPGGSPTELSSESSGQIAIAPDDLEVKDGYIFLKTALQRKISVAQVAREALFGKHGHQIMGMASTEPPGNPPVYAVQFAEVEVDIATGKVEVLKIAAAHDTGTVIHPPSVEGQIDGALQQGIGFALTEGMVYAADGRPLNASFADYKILTALDMPEIDTIIVEAPSETGAFGCKSIGESGLVATAAAIANAIYDAVGVRITELPITPDKLLKALREQQNPTEPLELIRQI